MRTVKISSVLAALLAVFVASVSMGVDALPPMSNTLCTTLQAE
jgi:hypothetical protein